MSPPGILHSVTILLLLAVMSAGMVRAEIPGAKREDAYTQREYARDLLAYNRQTTVEAYGQVGRHSPEWDERATAFLDAYAVLWTNNVVAEQYRVPGKDMAKLFELGAALVKSGCDDPMVLYCHAVSVQERGLGAEAIELLRRAQQQFEDSGYPAVRKARVAIRLAQLLPAETLAQAEADRAAWQLKARAVFSTELTGFAKRVMLTQHHILDPYNRDLAQWHTWAEKIEDPDPWPYHMVSGYYHLMIATTGPGWVAKEDTLSYAEHIAEARKHFVSAWEVQPKYPESATLMIRVLQVEQGTSLGPDVQRKWFERAVTGQFDHRPAYNQYFFGLSKLYGGSDEQMYDFAIECLETGRYDTKVPFELFSGLLHIRDLDGRSYSFWRRAGVYERIIELYEGGIAHSKRARDVTYYRLFQAIVAWRVGQYQDARGYLEQAGEIASATFWPIVDGVEADAIAEIYAKTGPAAKELLGAEQLISRGRYDEALKVYRQVLSDLPADARGFDYVRAKTQEAKWLKPFSAGKWVDLTPSGDLLCWSPRHGSWHVDEQGAIVGQSATDGLLMLLQVDFGKYWELSGQIDFGDYEGHANAGIITRFVTEPKSWSYLFYRKANKATAVRMFTYGDSEKIYVKVKNDFVVQMWRGHSGVVFNGELMFANFNPRLGDAKRIVPFGLGGAYTRAGVTVRFRNVKIRRLTKAPEWFE